MDAAEQITWKDRLVALAYYLGGTPLFWFSRGRREHPFLRQHYGQAAVVFLLLFAVITAFVLVITGLSYALVFQRTFYEGAHLERHLLTMTRRLSLCWMVFWGFSACLALLGSRREVLLVTRLAARPRVAAAGVLLLALLCGVVAAVTPFVVHANLIARSDARPGEVYLVYDDVEKFPRWIFTLGLYRISLASRARWGPDSVVALRLSPEAIQRACAEGRFLFLATHGKVDGLLYRGSWITPEDVDAMPVNEGLQYVHLTSCDSGVQRQAWEAAFAPARVVTFERLTAIVEHAWWLWFEGPEVIRQLE